MPVKVHKMTNILEGGPISEKGVGRIATPIGDRRSPKPVLADQHFACENIRFLLSPSLSFVSRTTAKQSQSHHHKMASTKRKLNKCPISIADAEVRLDPTKPLPT